MMVGFRMKLDSAKWLACILAVAFVAFLLFGFTGFR